MSELLREQPVAQQYLQTNIAGAQLLQHLEDGKEMVITTFHTDFVFDDTGFSGASETFPVIMYVMQACHKENKLAAKLASINATNFVAYGYAPDSESNVAIVVGYPGTFDQFVSEFVSQTTGDPEER